MSQHVEQLCVNAIRALTMDAVQKANSGHPGMPMGMADAAFVLWTRFLKHNPAYPDWPNRDRFILSAGHGSMLLYALLHLSGALPLEELKRFRQWNSKTPGHPEYGHTPGVETTTGPLGQGFANGVGMAIAERVLADRFNRPGYPVIDHFTYAIVSDGDLMEGISHEAASLAGHLGLGKLIYLYDANGISIDGSTDLTFTEDVAARFRAYGWQVLDVDGHDRDAVAHAIAEAQQDEEHPSLIICRTHIAYGSPNKQDTAASHGAPLGEEEVRLTKERLGWPVEPPFYVPEEVYAYFRERAQEWEAASAAWDGLFAAYQQEHPDLAHELQDAWTSELPPEWDADIPTFTPDQSMATRAASGKVLNAIAPRVPFLVGGSADLTGSNKTYLNGYSAIQRSDFSGRNIHFGVREHAMAAILNGMALHRGLRPYGGTFLVFSDYMRPAIRMAALMELPVIFVFTHDSIFVGEDGPTHQPVEHLASLRAIPNLVVIRPADANETAEAWRVALRRLHGPTALVLTRQGLPVIDRARFAPARHLARGAYILAREPGECPEVILLASGSEVHLALAAWERLVEEGVQARVVSMPSWELFEAQPDTYRNEVLPPDVWARVAIEAAHPQGWDRYVGPWGSVVAVRRFGASAPYKVLAEKFGFTVEHVLAHVEAVRQSLGQTVMQLVK